MFWDRYYSLCQEKGKSPNKVAGELGFSTSTATQWKRGAIPEEKNQQKVAAYFGVSVPYLLGYTDDRNPPAPPGMENAPSEDGAQQRAAAITVALAGFDELSETNQRIALEVLQATVETLRRQQGGQTD